MLNFQQYLEAKKIDKEAVLKAAKDAAEDIHGKADEDTLKDMIDSALEKGAKDTEDAIQMVIDMMRSKK